MTAASLPISRKVSLSVGIKTYLSEKILFIGYCLLEFLFQYLHISKNVCIFAAVILGAC